MPVVTIGSLGEGEFLSDHLLYISQQKARDLSAYALVPGDIVFSRVADVGRSVVIREGQAGWVMSSNMMRISLDPERAVPDYVRLNIAAHPGIRRQIRQHVNAGGRDVANQKVLNAIRFPWPEVEEQRRIVSAVEVSQAALTEQRRKLDKLHRLKTGLMQSLLHGRARVPAPVPA